MGVPNYIVRTFCATYNHEHYIKDALQGFVMQETTFPVVYTIVDDASTDRTAEVIREFVGTNFDLREKAVAYEKDADYGHVTFARHKINKNCFFAVTYLNENHYSQKKSKLPYIKEWEDTKYYALCEGDDYWTDPMKLQKQVDFLEGHEDYSMCFHKVDVLCDKKENWIFSDLEERDYSGREIYDKWLVPTCSVLYRKGEPFETHASIVYGDIYMYLQLAERGKLRCMGFVGGAYRRHTGSVSCGYSLQTCIKLYHQFVFMEKRFPEYKDISRREQEEQGLKGIINAPYFKGMWKYRYYYMCRHPRLFFSSFFTTTVLSYTEIGRRLTGKKI